MDFGQYLRLVRKRKWFILATTLLCALGAFGASRAVVPTYQAQAKVLVLARSQPGGGIDAAYQGALLSQQLVKSFAEVAQSRPVASAARERGPYPFTTEDLQRRIHAEPIQDTLLIHLTVEDTDPSRIRRLTNDVAAAFVQQVPRLQGGSTIQATLVEAAVSPSSPVKPQTKLNTLLGLLVGLLLGLGLALVAEMLDTTIRASGDVEAATALPVLASIPKFNAARNGLPVQRLPHSVQAEAFRKLRTNFSFMGVDQANVCCVVTSAVSGEGKSTITANLALALAQAGQRVAVVDGDLRRPTVHKLFRLPQQVGITTVLLGRADVDDALQPSLEKGVSVLTSGPIPPNPSELLGSRQMAGVIQRLRELFDVVLIDCSPLLPVTDPMVAAQFADGILLVTRAKVATKDQLVRARAVCERAGSRIFGVVLNAASGTEDSRSDYYTYRPDKSTERELLSMHGPNGNGQLTGRRHKNRPRLARSGKHS